MPRRSVRLHRAKCPAGCLPRILGVIASPLVKELSELADGHDAPEMVFKAPLERFTVNPQRPEETPKPQPEFDWILPIW